MAYYFAARLFYFLFHMFNGVTYREVEIQSTVPCLIEQFLGILRKLQATYFSKTSLSMRMEGRVSLFYSRSLQVSFWNIKEITGSFVCIVLVFF